MAIPDGFDRVREGRDEFLVRSERRRALVELLHRSVAGYAGTPVAGGRGATYAVEFEGSVAIVRPYRRGGLPGRFVRETYCAFGGAPRPFHELALIESLRRDDVPTIEPLAAAVQWVGWRRYRGWLVTRAVEGAESLWQVLSRQPTPEVRSAALSASAAAIARLHAVGASHPDLNLNNILVRGSHAWLIDFDGGRRHTSVARQRRSLARLHRSARKLDPNGRVISDDDWVRLVRASTGT